MPGRVNMGLWDSWRATGRSPGNMRANVGLGAPQGDPRAQGRAGLVLPTGDTLPLPAWVVGHSGALCDLPL